MAFHLNFPLTFIGTDNETTSGLTDAQGMALGSIAGGLGQLAERIVTGKLRGKFK